MHQIRFQLGLRPRQRGRSPRPPSWILGVLLLREERAGKGEERGKGRGKEGRGGEGRRKQGREGEGNYSRITAILRLLQIHSAVWVCGYNCARRAGTIWKLCEPKQRESVNRTALCPITGRGFGSGVSPPRNFCILRANLHSEPLPGKNDLQNYMQSDSWTCVWAKFSPYTRMMFMVWYSLIIISSIGSPMFTWLLSLHHSVDSIILGD